MLDVIVHCGPDGDGLYVEGGVALGMRRLSVIDLAYGWQPVAARTPSRRGLLFRRCCM